MPGNILTGATGSGKTSILRVLAEKPGYAVVEEAATDVIAREQALGNDEPWSDAGFVDTILAVQRDRQEEVDPGADVQMFDRSPICTLALAHYLGHEVPASLAQEIDRVARELVYERRVFLVRPMGFVEPTFARRISFEDSLTFERMHREVYLALGYELVDVPPAKVGARAEAVAAHITSWA